MLNRTAIVYWICYIEHNDPYTEGYIGVTLNPKSRFHSHQVNEKRRHIFNRIKKGAFFKILHSGISEIDAYALEKQYRPSSNIGWNIKPGGQYVYHPPGKHSTKRIPITLFGITYQSTTEAMRKLKISTSVLYYMKNNDCSMFSSVDDVRKHIWKERNKKLSLRETSNETKLKISQSSFGKPGTRNGAIVTNETRQKLSKTLTGKKAKIVTCPHCNTSGGINTMGRYHFDKCRLLINKIA